MTLVVPLIRPGKVLLVNFYILQINTVVVVYLQDSDICLHYLKSEKGKIVEA